MYNELPFYLQYFVVRKNSFKIPNVQSEEDKDKHTNKGPQTIHRKQRWNKMNSIKTRGGEKSYFPEE